MSLILTVKDLGLMPMLFSFVGRICRRSLFLDLLVKLLF